MAGFSATSFRWIAMSSRYSASAFAELAPVPQHVAEVDVAVRQAAAE